MDYIDHLSGHNSTSFYFQAKEKMLDMLLRQTGKEKSSRILNLGCGTGNDLKIISNFGSVYLLDIDKKALDLVPEGMYHKKVHGDACNLPFEDNYFDIVISFDVFEHIQKDTQALSETKRVLKKGGILLFSVPAFQVLFSSHDKSLGHYRRYNLNDLKQKVSQFNIKFIAYWNSFLFPCIAIHRLLTKNNKSPSVDNPSFPKLVNSILTKILIIETYLTIKNRINLPWGISLIGIAVKN